MLPAYWLRYGDGNRQLSADSVENSRPWFAHQNNTRPRLKSLLLAEASGLEFHVAALQKRRFHQSMTKQFGQTDFFNRIGQNRTLITNV